MIPFLLDNEEGYEWWKENFIMNRFSFLKWKSSGISDNDYTDNIKIFDGYMLKLNSKLNYSIVIIFYW